MKCENYKEDERQCRYFEALIGTDEECPTGMDESNGRCNAIEEKDGDWYDVESEDCDMFDLN